MKEQKALDAAESAVAKATEKIHAARLELTGAEVQYDETRSDSAWLRVESARSALTRAERDLQLYQTDRERAQVALDEALVAETDAAMVAAKCRCDVPTVLAPELAELVTMYQRLGELDSIIMSKLATADAIHNSEVRELREELIERVRAVNARRPDEDARGVPSVAIRHSTRGTVRALVTARVTPDGRHALLPDPSGLLERAEYQAEWNRALSVAHSSAAGSALRNIREAPDTTLSVDTAKPAFHPAETVPLDPFIERHRAEQAKETRH